MTRCPRCGADNAIVNQCGCDPNNMPTKPLVELPDPKQLRRPLIIEWGVKVLRLGKKRWEFLASKGTTNGLRVHALRFRTLTDADNTARDIEEGNPGVKAKVITF